MGGFIVFTMLDSACDSYLFSSLGECLVNNAYDLSLEYVSNKKL